MTMNLNRPDPDIEPIPYCVIPLTQGQVALVDQEDYERVSKHKWCALYACKRYDDGVFYAVRGTRRGGKQVFTYLHRFVLNAPAGLEVDHIYVKDTLDCRRANLRLATKSQNMANQRKARKPASSRYKGVSWHQHTKKWRARIGVNRRNMHLGLFSSESDAALAYNRAATLHFGQFALLNTV